MTETLVSGPTGRELAVVKLDGESIAFIWHRPLEGTYWTVTSQWSIYGLVGYLSYHGPDREEAMAALRRWEEESNPAFVESLMGWPSGLINFGSSAMESYPSWRRRHLSTLRASLLEVFE